MLKRIVTIGGVALVGAITAVIAFAGILVIVNVAVGILFGLWGAKVPEISGQAAEVMFGLMTIFMAFVGLVSGFATVLWFSERYPES